MADDIDLDGHQPALIINCDPLLTRTIEVTGSDGVVYRLRDDVSTDRLIWGFSLLDIERRMAAAGSWEEREAALDDRDRERLNLTTTIVRHSYPTLTRAEVERTFTGAQMEELLGYFFTNRLLPLLAQRLASARETQEVQDSQEPTPTPTVKTSRRKSSASVDVTP